MHPKALLDACADASYGARVVAVGADLAPATLLTAYRNGLFPMPEGRRVGWWSPVERGVLPLAYFQNLASYVQDGGALLISSGPEFAGPESIYRTPLSQVLPVQPTGQIVTGPFKPIVTADTPSGSNNSSS